MEKNFIVSPRIIAHLGEDLIKNESIALLELVKNAYDADAQNCIVDFYSEDKQLKKITITDDGCGMNIQTIEGIWLVIGTDNKKNTLPTSKGRYQLGEKGIGRLGIHKLGAKIHLISKTINDKEVELHIDLAHLNDAQKIEDFTIEIFENECPKYFKNNQTGTIIIIEKIKTQWDKKQQRDIYRNLMSLNSPFSDKNDSFKVVINSNEDIFEGLLKWDELIENCGLYFGRCTLKGNRIVDFQYEFRPWSSLEKIDGRVIDISKLQEHELYLTGLKEVEGKKRSVEYDINLDTLQIGEIKFDIIIFEKDAIIFNFIDATKKAIMTEYLRENGGIRVYRDNVRVYNYGERDNDWLGIDLKRVHRVGGNVSNNIILGSVRLNRKESSGLKEKTNREGFIENESYAGFVDAVNYVLDIFVRLRNEDKTRLTTIYKPNKYSEPVLSDLNSVIEIVKSKVSDKNGKEDILKYLYRIDTQYKTVKEVLIKSANAGLNLSVVIHEIEKQIKALTKYAIQGEKDNIIKISMRLEQIVRGYTAMIRKSAIGNRSLSEIALIAVDNYQFRFSDHKIEVFGNYKDSKLCAFLAEAEAISTLTNLLDNSVYWVRVSKKENRKISIFITDEIEGYNSIVVSDNGPGFNMGTDIALQPFISGKPHSIGTGLGLHIANEMMKAMNGKLLFLEDNDIEFPQYVKDNQIDKSIIALCFPKEKGKK